MSRDKQTGFHISKESVDKLFPKKDIDILGYEPPIQAFIGQMRIEHERTLESETIKAVRAIDVSVDKEELIKALQYDRNQYEKGYINGYNAKASEVAEEIFAEIEKKISLDLDVICKEKDELIYKGFFSHALLCEFNYKIDTLRGIAKFIAELKKKYTEGKAEIPPYVRMEAKALPATLNVKYTEEK
jgi:glutamate synthase domain-containing protein 1